MIGSNKLFSSVNPSDVTLNLRMAFIIVIATMMLDRVNYNNNYQFSQ